MHHVLNVNVNVNFFTNSSLRFASLRKMLGRDVRHLLVRDGKESENIIGLISVKDIVKCTHENCRHQQPRTGAGRVNALTTACSVRNRNLWPPVFP